MGSFPYSVIQSWLGTVGVAVATFFTMFGEDLICVAIIGFLYWCWDKELGKLIGLNLLFAVTMSGLIKNIFMCRRPYFDNDGIKCLMPVDSKADLYDVSAQGFSFPSIHATKAVTLFTSLGIFTKNKIMMVIGIVLPLLVGVGLYFGVNTLLKMPFTFEFLDSGTTLAFAVRAMRYLVITFVIIGVYPLMFRVGDKIFINKSA